MSYTNPTSKPKMKLSRFLSLLITATLAISGVVVLAAPANAATQQVVFAQNYEAQTPGVNGTGVRLALDYDAEMILNNHQIGAYTNAKMTFANGDIKPLYAMYINESAGVEYLVFQWETLSNNTGEDIWPMTFSADITVDYTIDCDQLPGGDPGEYRETYENFDGSMNYVKSVQILNCEYHFIRDFNTDYNPLAGVDGIWAVTVPPSCEDEDIRVGGYNISGPPQSVSWTYYFSNVTSGCGGGSPDFGADVDLTNYFVVEGFTKGKAILTSSMKSFISKEVATAGSSSKFSCTGTVRGKKWTEAKEALALARAKVACDYVSELYPDATIQLKKRLIKKKKQDALTVRISVFKVRYFAPPA